MSHSHRGFSPVSSNVSFTPGFSPVLAYDNARSRFNGINLLDGPVLAPEQQDVYSLQRDTARALQRSAMDANDGGTFRSKGYKHLAPAEQRQVRQVY